MSWGLPGRSGCEGAVLCSGHVGFAPRPAGQGTGRVGAFGVKEGSRCTSLGLFNLDGCSPRGCLWVQGGSGGGPRFPFPQRTLSQGQAGWCCAFGGQEQVLLWSGPDPTSTGAVLAPAPGLPVVGLCRRCCMGVLGVFSQLLALARSPGEKFLVSRPHVSLPSHCGCVAPARFCRKPRGGAGQSCPCPGGSRFAGAAALGLFGLSCAAGS